MPRPILNTPNKTFFEEKLDVQKKNTTPSARVMTKVEEHHLFRKKRSKEYINAMKKLDAGGHMQCQNKVNEIIDAIKNEFPEVQLHGVLIGVVSICYLGVPYEVHALDMTGEIIEHYEVGHPMPDGLESARSIAIRGGYEFIEVYHDCFRCVSSNGSVAVVPR